MSRILVVGRPGLSTSIFANELLKAGYEIIIVFENRPPVHQTLALRVRRLGLLVAMGQLLFVAYARLVQRFHSHRINQILSDFKLEQSLPECIRVCKVENVNSHDFISIVKTIEPDLVFVSGSRVIKGHVINDIEAPIINCHFGITPQYRGVHGGYWAMVNSDAENFGSTIHAVDEGVDTGEIISQVRYRPSEKDNYFTYPCLQAAIAAPALLAAIKQQLMGKLQYQSPQGLSRQWYHPTIWGYFKTGIFRGLW